MKIYFSLTLFTCKALLKNIKSLILLIMIPALFLLGAGIIISQSMQSEEKVNRFPVAIVDKDDTAQTKYVIEQLTEGKLRKIMKPLYTNEQKAKQLLQENKVAAIVTLPKGFSHDIAHGKNQPLHVIGNNNKPLQSQLFRYVMESAADYTSAAQSGINTVDAFLEKENVSDEKRRAEFKKSLVTFGLHVLDRGSLFDEQVETSFFQQDMKQYYVLSFAALLLMIWSYGGWLLASETQTSPVLDRMKTRGVSFLRIYLAQLTALFVLLLPVSVVLFGSIIKGLKLPVTGTYGELFLGISGSLFAFLCLFLLLRVLFLSQKAYQLTGLLFILLSAILSGHVVPVVYLPDWASVFQKLSLNTRVLELLFYEFDGYNTNEAFLYLKPILITAAGSFLLAVGYVMTLQRRWRK
ncbi:MULTISPECIES: ABC transporter permease [Priestia]|uniref:ABC transporter permease n=1 Tax=Priestia TaxID=2800373 RepID=UPI001C8D0711|nr:MULTISPECIES: ABC transporter permease [Priestia]MBX9987721.1 ABC transporter permease [Priestia aryabhattai]MBX9998654.1 ABC transporter permease [Priestia aryabhattai]UYV54156.1 ABC transporter permease [Priestia megaterium]